MSEAPCVVPKCPHGRVRPVHHKSSCLTQFTLGPYVVQIWSRHPPNGEEQGYCAHKNHPPPKITKGP